ncbi:MAG: hypothetical protein SNJ78_03675 [Spirochaetales bacterium]
MERGKVMIWMGVGGFVFSILFGFLGGVFLLTLLFRALLGGFVFALLGAGVYTVVERFLPELLHTNFPPKDEGNVIDVVIPEHNPHLEESLSSKDTTEENLDDFVEEIEEVAKPLKEPLFVSEETQTQEKPSQEESSEDLPDLGKFSDSFAEAIPIEGNDSLGNPFKGKPQSTDEDPAVIAKAIQTLLKKDREG